MRRFRASWSKARCSDTSEGRSRARIKQQLGKFELASGGTLFLDEIGDLPLDLQAKLLRAIQEGEIERVGGTKPIKTDFRLIAATNVDLEKAVKDGRFREDLFYRINVIPIKMPPLRDRIEDLPELARFFLGRYTATLPEEDPRHLGSTLKILSEYWWPGNIRELENLIERLVAVSDKEWITDEDLPFEFHFAQLERIASRGESLFQEATNTFERNFILRALEKCGVERHCDGPLSRDPAQHAEIQDGSARHPRAREETSRSVDIEPTNGQSTGQSG